MKKSLLLTIALVLSLVLPFAVVSASAAEAYVAEVIDVDGTTVVGQYETFADAYEAATEGQTIKLLGAVTAADPVALTKTVTIDGNGQTYTFTGAGDADNKVFTAAFKAETAGVTTTIKNITVTATGAWAPAISVANGTVVLESGTYTAAGTTALYVSGGVATVGAEGAENSTVNLTACAGNPYGVIHADGGDLTVNCATVRSSHTTSNGNDNTRLLLAQGSSTVHIKNADMQVTSANGAGTVLWTEGTNVTLTIDNGTYVQTGGGRMLDPRSGAKKITINGGTFAVNGGYFGRLAGAFDIEINGGTFTQSGSGNFFNFTGDSNVEKLTINGGTFTLNGGAIIYANGANVAVTVTKGIFNNTADNGVGIQVHGGATLTIDPANDADVKFDVHRYLIQGSAGTINIKGGTFITAGAGNASLMNTDGAYTVNIDGGIFTYNGTYIALNVTAAGAALNINGGTFTAAGGVIIYAGNANATLNIKAGNFTNKAGNGFGVHNGATLTIDPANDADVVFNIPNYVIQGSGGTINIKGGTFNKTGTGAQRLMNDDGAYTVNIDGGIYNYNGSYYAFDIDNAGTVLNINGGTITAPRGHGLVVGAGTTVNITGGTITANGIGINNVGTLNFTGGSLTSNTTTALFVSDGTATVGTAGAKATNNITIVGKAVYPNAVIVANAGTLTLNNIAPQSSHTASNGGNDNSPILLIKGTANVIVNDCTFDLTANGAGTIFWSDSANASLTINGGTYTQVGGGRMLDPRAGAKKITINGGTFAVNGGYFGRLAGAFDIEINGGTFTQAGATNFFNFTGDSSVEKLTINGGTFTTGGGAFIGANGANVEVTITKGTFNNKANNGMGIQVHGGATITIDPAKDEDVVFDIHRYTIQGSAGTINIKGGTFTTAGASNAMLMNADGAYTVNIDGGIYNYNGTYVFMLIDKGAQLNINGGTFTAKNGCARVVQVAAGSAKITGGTFTNTTNNGAGFGVYGEGATITIDPANDADVKFDVHRYLIQGTAGTINVTGGTFVTAGYNNARLLNTDGAYTANLSGGIYVQNGTYHGLEITQGTVNITGGTFSANNTLLYVAGGTVNVENVIMTNANERDLILVNGGDVTIGSGTYYTDGKAISKAADVSVKVVGTINTKAGEMVFDTETEFDDTYINIMNGKIQITSSATVRLVEGSTGLRFISKVPGNLLPSTLKSWSSGTIIIPAELLESAGLKAVTEKILIDSGFVEGVDYLKIESTDKGADLGAGGVEIRAALVNIKEANYGKKFVAIPYLTYTDENGTTITANGEFDINAAVSISDVANKSLADLSDTRVSLYRYETYNGKFSMYSIEQRKVLAAYTVMN